MKIHNEAMSKLIDEAIIKLISGYDSLWTKALPYAPTYPEMKKMIKPILTTLIRPRTTAEAEALVDEVIKKAMSCQIAKNKSPFSHVGFSEAQNALEVARKMCIIALTEGKK